MAELISWQSAGDPYEVIDRAVEALAAGKLVGFPTETVYGIAADVMNASAIERLVHCKGRPEDKPLTLALSSPEESRAWVPGMSKLGRRLSRRCWPGPVTLVFQTGLTGSLAEQLPEEVRRRVCPDGSIGLRVPAHDAIGEAIRILARPLVLTSANRSGESPAKDGCQIVESLGDRLDLVIDDGPTRYGQASTVVRVSDDHWELLREGVVPAHTIAQLTPCMILFVCTGNTCRSPLAEGMCKKLLAERLGCCVEELPARGFVVLSAGISAMIGGGATAEAIETAKARGISLEGHVSRPLTPGLLSQADYVFAMSQGHRTALEIRYPPIPDAGTRIQVLSPAEEDIPDPIGGDRQLYESCAAQIAGCLEQRLPEIEP